MQPLDPVAVRQLFLRQLVMTIGLLLNASVVWVTIKCKNLRSHCNLLIAFECLFIGLYQLNGFATLAIAFAGVGTVNVRLCCLIIQPVPIFGVWASQVTMLLIALDRLSAILFPTWYHGLTSRHNGLYLAIMSVACLANGGLNLAFKLAWTLNSAQTKTVVPCAILNCNDGTNSTLSFAQQIVCTTLTCAAYTWLWLLLRHKSIHGESHVDSQRIFRALATLVTSYTAGFIGSNLVRIWFNQWPPEDPNVARNVAFLCAIFINLNQAINMPVLVIFNSEYRKAYMKWLWPCGGRAGAIMVAPVAIVPRMTGGSSVP